MSTIAPVLISGAGPSGLLLGLWLSKYSVPFRIVDKTQAPYETSRAIVMHARSLELYRMLGIADQILEAGTRVDKFVINCEGKRKGELRYQYAGRGQSYYSFILSITQDEHEHILSENLEKNGTVVERGVEVVGLQLPSDNAADVAVTLRSTHFQEDQTIRASYVIGCDGAHSGVRHAVGIAMEGGTYSRRFFVADVLCHGEMQTQGEVNACLSEDEFVVILALPHKSNRARIIGFVPIEYEDLTSVSFDDCRPAVAKCAPGIIVDEVRWFATYNVHHRCAASFQYGPRVFLCGDSAHLHSPVGGQGMNTGLGDVSNLAWKLATAWHAANGTLIPEMDSSRAQDLLATYTTERRPFADQLVRSNDRMFQIMIAQNVLGWLVRNILLPYVMPFLFSRRSIRGLAFPRLSQTGIEYRSSPLSKGIKGGDAMAGDRLPWIAKAGGDAGQADNHSLLDGMSWQIHIFEPKTPPSSQLEEMLHHRKIPVYNFPLTAEAKYKGFLGNALYVIRPDGHIGLVVFNTVGVEEHLEAYFVRYGVGRPQAS